MTTIADLFTKYNCTNCQDDIQGIRVHCTECENFYLCLQCFASGAEIGVHENDHAYQFMDTGTAILSVFRGRDAWTAREEIRLLDAIEQFGFGNWEDISKHIETKSAEDAKEEYINKFVHGTIGRHTWIPAQSQRPTLIDHTCDDMGPLGTASLQRLPPLNVSAEEATQLGYMPNRDSFEREYDPTAEQLISGLSLNTDDTEADYLLKLAHVDLYTRRLRDRVRRKRLVRDYQLVANFFRNRNCSQYPNISREQKESRNRFRVFAQFYTANEYERLINSLEREKDLRVRLSELYRYRHNGLTKIADCRHFEQHAVLAGQRVTLCYGLGKTLPCIISTPNCERLNGCIRQCLTTGQYALQPWKLSAGQLLFTFPASKQAHTLSNESDTNLNSIAPNSMYHTVDQISSDELLHNKNYLDSYLRSSEATTRMLTMMGTAATNVLQTAAITTCNKNALTTASPNSISVVQPQFQQFLADPITTKIKFHPTNDNTTEIPPREIVKLLRKEKYTHQQFSDLYATNTKASMSSILKSQLDDLEHLSLPLGANLLSSNEQQLCNIFNLSATTYITLKTLILSGAHLSSQNVSSIENTLRKYFIKVGWLGH